MRPLPRSAPVCPGSIRRLGHRPALDGIRGIAWCVVFVSHAMPTGGFAFGEVAMVVFFALSGFLITELLLEERVLTGRIRLGNFFMRRGLRLLPALYFFLAMWLVVVAIFGGMSWTSSVPGGGPGSGVPVGTALQGVGAAVGYVTNWFTIFHLFSGYVPLGHLWSLAVEEQFYLVWAPVVVVLAWRHRWVGLGAGMLAALSFADVSLLRHSSSLALVVDMGTGARAAAFLVGGAAASVWMTRRFWLGMIRGHLGSALLASLVCMVWAGWAFDHRQSVLSFGVMWVAVALASTLLVVVAVEAQGALRRVLGHPVLTYLGRRSYALYLWHYVWLTWFRHWGLDGVALALVASLASAEISWRLVERPALSLKKRISSRPGATPAPSGALQLRSVTGVPATSSAGRSAR